MSSLGARVAILASAGLIIFGVVAAIMLKLLPGPLRPTDYLVVGAVATFVSLAAVFVALITGYLKVRDVFFRRRQKPNA